MPEEAMKNYRLKLPQRLTAEETRFINGYYIQPAGVRLLMSCSGKIVTEMCQRSSLEGAIYVKHGTQPLFVLKRWLHEI